MTKRSLIVAAALLAVVFFPEAAGAAITLKAPAKKRASFLVTFKGKAGTRKGARVAVQRRRGQRWKVIATGRTARHGRFALTWITPSKRSLVFVRAHAGRRSSKIRRLRILPPRKGAKKIKVSPKTRILAATAVKDVPDPGKAGEVTYAGGNDVKPGAIVVVGQGADTPDGFIGRVTDVDQKNGQTVADTKPASLLDAVPEGSTDLVAKAVTATTDQAGRRAGSSKITCEGSAGVSIVPDVSFTAGLTFDGSWSIFHGGLQSASVTATADLDASLTAMAQAAGSCSLDKRSIFKVKGPSVSGFIGPVPIVMTSDLNVYVDASAGVSGQITTSADAGFSASAGVQYTKGNGFSGTQSFTPHFGFDPPTLSASANVGAHLTPTVDVLLYGVAGPQIALKTGLDFNADTSQDPWWTLTVPVDLTAAVSIPALDLTSPELHVYQQDFPIADAGGPFGSSAPPATGVTDIAQPTIAAGYDQSCALRSNGGAICWGGNGKGQLGNGSTNGSSVPVTVSGLTDVVGLAAGIDHTCALRNKGAVSCWGVNGGAKPTPVTSITNATFLAASADRTCARLSTGHVTCWAADNKTAEVSGVTNATSIAVGTSHACAVKTDHTVTCWGSNTGGELGNGTTSPQANPVAVTGISDATAVSAGTNHACALRSTGAVACWGDNFYGQSGNGGAPTDSPSPVAVSGITTAVAIGSGGAHTCAVLASGSVQCWGWNNYGQIGDGGSSASNRPSPSTVKNISNATAVAGGLEHTCALLKTGGLRCWGYGGDGELGNGGNGNSSTPVTVSGAARRAL